MLMLLFKGIQGMKSTLHSFQFYMVAILALTLRDIKVQNCQVSRSLDTRIIIIIII